MDRTTPTSSGLHVVVGAGPIGSAVARRLAAGGATVRVVTRSGRGPLAPNIELVAADASHAERLTHVAHGASAIYNCANPTYSRWAQDWPPLAASLLAAAAKTGAVLATASNIYGYGLVDGPMTEDLPLNATFTNGRVRNQMWRDALAASQAGKIRMVEVRGADYVGPHAESQLGERTIPRLLTGKTVRVLGNPDLPHSWTYTEDMAHALVQLASDEKAYGRAWHAPVTHRTQREALTDFARLAGVPLPTIAPVPQWMLAGLGMFNPDIREIRNVLYQVDNPYMVDDTAIRTTFELTPTTWDDVVRATLAEFTAAQAKAA